MPFNPYIVAGRIYDGAKVLIEGAIVYVRNITTPGQSSTLTTAANGEFEFNLADFDDGYSDGDSYEVVATYVSGGYQETRRVGTIDQPSGGDQDQDIFLDTLAYKASKSMREHSKELYNKGWLSRAKKAFQVWANDKAATSSATMVKTGGAGWGRGFTTATFPGINLASGEVAYIEQLTIMVRTSGKVCDFDIAKAAGADGAGNVVALCGTIYVPNGTIVEPRPYTIKFANPIRVEYNAETAKSIGVRTAGTDSSTKVDFIMEGYILTE